MLKDKINILIKSINTYFIYFVILILIIVITQFNLNKKINYIMYNLEINNQYLNQIQYNQKNINRIANNNINKYRNYSNDSFGQMLDLNNFQNDLVEIENSFNNNKDNFIKHHLFNLDNFGKNENINNNNNHNNIDHKYKYLNNSYNNYFDRRNNLFIIKVNIPDNITEKDIEFKLNKSNFNLKIEKNINTAEKQFNSISNYLLSQNFTIPETKAKNSDIKINITNNQLIINIPIIN